MSKAVNAELHISQSTYISILQVVCRFQSLGPPLATYDPASNPAHPPLLLSIKFY